YLMLTVVLWALAFLAHLLERETDRTAPPALRTAAIALLLIGGYGLTGTWFLEGVLGVPRRYAIQPPGTAGYSLVGSIFALLFALGFATVLTALAPLARSVWARRQGLRLADGRVAVGGPARAGAPLATGGQLAFGAAVCVISLAAFFPQVVHASEAGIRYHHLDHTAQFLLGTMLGLLLGSLPAISARLGERPSAGLITVIVAPALMMLLMVPRFYEPLERHPFEHALYHVGMAALGLVTGLAASRLTALGGRFTAFLSVGMVLMFAAAMKGG